MSARAHGGIHIGRIWCERPSRLIVEADRVWEERDGLGRTIVCYSHHNAYVRSGLRNLEQLQAGLGGRAVTYLGLDNDNTAVTLNTRFLHGASAGGATASTPTSTQLFVAVTATIVTDGSGVTQYTTYQGPTLTQASFTAGVFKVNKVGLMLAAVDADGNLVDVVGGASGTQPYERTFGVDNTGVGAFQYTPGMQTYSIADPTQ